MITIFNGRKRVLGEGEAPSVYAQIDLEMREHLHLLKGARLAVLLAIALHADEDGWAWPSYKTLMRETGYGLNTIKKALADLCELRINGRRVLLRYQPTGAGGRFESNRYLIFPSPEEVERYEGAGITHLGAEAANRGTESVPRSTVVQKTVVRKVYHEQEPNRTITNQEEEGEIATRLQRCGIFQEPAREIAALMAGEGLSADEAERIALETLRVTDGNVRQVVYRLRRRIWDAGQTAEQAVARARYGGVDSAPDPPTSLPDDDDPSNRIWERVLAELELEMTRATFNTHLRRSRLVAYDDGIFTVAVVNEYAKDWLEHRLAPLVCRVLRRLTGRDEVSVRFVAETEWAGQADPEAAA